MSREKAEEGIRTMDFAPKDKDPHLYDRMRSIECAR